MKCRQFVLGSVPVVSLGGTTQAAAQERNPRFELGVTRAWEGLDTHSRIGGQGGYLGFFLSPRLLLANRVTLALNDGGNRFHVGSDLNYLFRGPKVAGPYASIGLDGTWGGRDDTADDTAASLGAGYRLPMTDRLTLQAGLLHRRSLRDQGSQTGLSLGFGFNIGSRR